MKGTPSEGPFRIGLTGSIGMGKSTTAAMFAEAGAEVWDADVAVHRLYAPGGAAVAGVTTLCPEAVRDGAVDRTILAQWVRTDPGNLPKLEKLVHPMVAADRTAFLARAKSDVVVLDIPLLFENRSQGLFDLTVVASAPPKLQRSRVLARPGMTEEKLNLILSRQMPDAEKRRLADVVVDTSTLEGARQAVQILMAEVRAGGYARNRSRHRDNGI